MSNGVDRGALLAMHHARVARLLRSTGGHAPAGGLAAYVVNVAEPTGYLIAAGLQRRYRDPDPDRALLISASTGTVPPVLVGVVGRAVLAETLATLTPATQRLAVELQQPEEPGAERVLVAAGGEAELLVWGGEKATAGAK